MRREAWDRACRARAHADLGWRLDVQRFTAPSEMPSVGFDCLLYLRYALSGHAVRPRRVPAQSRYTVVHEIQLFLRSLTARYPISQAAIAESEANSHLCIEKQVHGENGDAKVRAVVFLMPSPGSHELTNRLHAIHHTQLLEHEAGKRQAEALRALFARPDVAWAWWAAQDSAKLASLPEQSFRNLLDRLAEHDASLSGDREEKHDSVLAVIIDYLNNVKPEERNFALQMWAVYLERAGHTDLVKRLDAIETESYETSPDDST